MSKRRDLVGGLLVCDGRLLLGRRSPEKKGWPNTWDMPGGHVEKGERFKQALVREIEEEIGVRPVSFERIAKYKLDTGQRYRIFRVDGWQGGEPELRNDEHTELRWFSVAEACLLQPLALEAYRELFASLELSANRRDD